MAEELNIESHDETVDGAAILLKELLSQSEEEGDIPESRHDLQADVEGAAFAAELEGTETESAFAQSAVRATEHREEAPPEFSRAEARRLENLDRHVPQLARAMLEEFSDLKTEADLVRLGTENPERYNRFQILREQLQRAAGEQRVAASQSAVRQQESEARALGEALPELRDPAKAPQLIADLRAFARKAGYTQEQLAKASAKDWALLSKAMRFEAGHTNTEKRLENARRRAAPPSGVQRPGVAREHLREESLRSDFQRLRKTGYVRDAASVIRHIMN